MTAQLSGQLTLEAKFFKGLADKSRLTILEALMDKERRVGEIIEATGLTQSNASMHLACLLDCGLVYKTRRGQYMQYRLANEEIRELVAIMRKIVSQHTQEILACTHDYEHKGTKDK